MNTVQERILEIYKCIKCICDNKQIPYYAIGGTAIGAVRHNGFIPWDDDIDIAIPIEYYWYFFKCAEEQLPSYYSIKHCRNDRYYVFPFGKIIDERTTFIEEWEKGFTNLYKGVFVDVMPIAGVPGDNSQQKKYMSRLLRYILMNRWRRIPASCSVTRSAFLIKCVFKLPLLMFTRDYFFDKYMNLLARNPFYKSNMTGYTWGLYNEKTIMFPTEIFLETIDIPFEDTYMKCPAGYDKMLSIQFNDYMKLPPEDQRVSIHSPFIDLNTPYKEYVIKDFRGRK